MAQLANFRHERFAQLVASGKTGAEAYVIAGYSRAGAKQSASRLLSHADLRSRIRSLQSAIADSIVKLAITDRGARLAALEERRDLLRTVVKERAADPNNQSAAGGKTGLMCRTVKMIGGGESAHEVDEFVVDTGLLRELREIERQAAIECGDWVEKRDLGRDGNASMAVNVTVRQELIDMGPEFAREYLALVKAHKQQRHVGAPAAE